MIATLHVGKERREWRTTLTTLRATAGIDARLSLSQPIAIRARDGAVLTVRPA